MTFLPVLGDLIATRSKVVPSMSSRTKGQQPGLWSVWRAMSIRRKHESLGRAANGGVRRVADWGGGAVADEGVENGREEDGVGRGEDGRRAQDGGAGWARRREGGLRE